MNNEYLWEILIPTHWPGLNGLGPVIGIEDHKKWDEQCRMISSGMTIMRPAKGFWRNENEEFVEEMIPVRLTATLSQMKRLAEYSREFYKQYQIMFYKISDEVHFV